MKSKSHRWVVIFSCGLGLVLFVLANSGVGQGNIQTESGKETLPDLSHPASSSVFDRQSKSSEINQDDSNIDNSNPTDKKTLYDKFGPTATPSDNPYGITEHRGRFTHGKKAEKMVTIESKGEGIKKTKYGSSDASESTGVFKESLLDVGLNGGVAPAAEPSATPSATINPLRKAREAAAASSPAAHPLPSIDPASARIDITAGISPGASVSPAATPQR